MNKSFISLIIACIFTILVSVSAQGQPLIAENLTLEVVEHSEEAFSGLVFIPSSHDFGTVGTGSHKTYNFQLKNNGASQASGSVYLFGDPDFSCIAGCSYNLNYSQSQYVTIRFAPCNTGELYITIYAGSAQATASGVGVFSESCD